MTYLIPIFCFILGGCVGVFLMCILIVGKRGD